MPVRYVDYHGKRVSRYWNTVLRAADADGVSFHVTSGHRTMAEQQRLFDQNMIRPGVPKPGRPLTAVPNRNAPHIRTGRANHALDISSLDGGETRFERWIESQGASIDWINTVRGEPWHGEVSREDLERLARKLRRRAKPKPKRKPKTQAERDRELATRLRRHGARFAIEIIEEARRERVPLPWALALIEQETDFRNIFGGDHGPLKPPTRVPFFRVAVTHERVLALLRWIERGNASNGVGPAQLTSVGFIRRAEAEGGAHKPRINIRVGLQALNEKSGRDYHNQAWKYNGARSYQAKIEAKQRKWREIV